MKLKKMDASVLNRICKGTVHKTGKLGFNADAADMMRLQDHRGARIFMNDEDNSDDNLYVKLLIDKVNSDEFKISKAGEYYYLNCKGLFDKLGYNYEGDTIIYDIRPKEIEGDSYFEFKRRSSSSGSSAGGI